jgi:acyl dehydratase
MNHESNDPLYLEDLRVGQRFASSVYQLSERQIKAFAAEFDPQPFHLDNAAAQKSIFRGLAASGWHTAAVTMRLLVTGKMQFAAGTIGLGGEIEWPLPVRPGDSLHVESEITEISPSRTKPDRGVVTVRSVTFNQDGAEVQRLIAKLLVFRRFQKSD